MNYVLQVLFILVLMTIGYAARRRGMVSAVGTSEMVRVLIAVIYPCLIFSSVTRLDARELAANWIMPVMALAHYQLARAYEESGWTRRAALKYQFVVDLWQNADPGGFT